MKKSLKIAIGLLCLGTAYMIRYLQYHLSIAALIYKTEIPPWPLYASYTLIAVYTVAGVYFILDGCEENSPDNKTRESAQSKPISGE